MDPPVGGWSPLGSLAPGGAVATWGRVRDWVLLEANRYGVALGLLAVGFAGFAWIEHAGVTDFDRTVAPMLYLFSALAGGNVTLITLVISINQLVLSRELRSPREVRTEMSAVEDYRESIEEETDRAVVPERPGDFLQLLTEDTRRHLTALYGAASESENDRVREELAALDDALGRELDSVVRLLEKRDGSVLGALLTILDAEFATHINHSRWIRRMGADDLSPSVEEDLEGLERRLDQLDVARQYFKTVYIQQELSDVSKLVMYSGVVAVFVAIVFLMITGYLARELSQWEQLVSIPLAVTVALLPLSLLISHVLRIATIARRTVAITPFLAPSE